jgi:patatin-like phospholipase/acyl hydrolase
MAFHVLALAGGGIRGLHTAHILEMIEQQLGGPIARHFDLICGTSIGGILALGLALEHPAADLKKMLVYKRADVFSRPVTRRFLSWIRAKHPAAPLRAELERVFKGATMGDLLHPVVIPAVDASAGTAVMFKTPHDSRFVIDRHRKITDVALATAAAPTYFPVFRAPDARLFVDGGLIANAPSLCGLHEAEIFFKQQVADVRMLAIGTASVGRNVRAHGGKLAKLLARIPGCRDVAAAAALDLGVLRWGARVFDLTISAQESLAHNLVKHRLEDRYSVVDSKIDTERSRDIERLNAVSKAAVDTLLAAAAKTGQEFIGSTDFGKFVCHQARAADFSPKTATSSETSA